ncbi:hypothetical protein [Methanoplanus limicola]|uniref:Methyltransferase n=1 Tax=Methanoplanus limicola DSM 2279 TaxID=937775 RepID=H1Z0L1_9EURY|nr:hypothetical protein [Methanoplanus limicola]EHQ35268.1 hypothetical protein Metlim_1157 [Methanoplanus limicola DSM 2279]
MDKLLCPVCGGNCIAEIDRIPDNPRKLFSPCSRCRADFRDKSIPPSGDFPLACPECGRRFIDDVMAHCHRIISEEEDDFRSMSLSAVGMPLLSPGIFMLRPPFLSPDSVVLLSKSVTRHTADRIFHEVPEIKGVILDREALPGIGPDGYSGSNELICGCDVRGDIFQVQKKRFIIYKQQSLCHIEYPKGSDPKIEAVRKNVLRNQPDIFVDAFCGCGTLGIAASITGAQNVILNDAWYSSAWWSAINILANRSLLGADEVIFRSGLEKLSEKPVMRPGDPPSVVAEASGAGRSLKVIHGDYRSILKMIPDDKKMTSIAAIDVFDKENTAGTDELIRWWNDETGGDSFIP